MRQRTILLPLVALVLASVAFRTQPTPTPPAPPAPTTRPAPAIKPTVASLVPSATDLILASGLRDQLLAVSKYCRSNPDAAGIPSVGDYETIDWEKISSLHPNVMLLFKARDRIAQGVVDRANQQSIQLDVVKVETIADVHSTLTRLGDLLEQPQATAALSQRINSQLDTVKKAIEGKHKPRTLLVVGSANLMIIGPDTFLHELLTIAGGTNAADKFTKRYQSIDEETLISLKPEKIIVLLPSAGASEVAEATARWSRRLKGDKSKFTILTDWYLLHPGSHLGDTATTFAKLLHPDATLPTTQGAP